MFKERKGITLIALFNTIIVLLILAGVTIATLTGNNGVLTKANTAKERTEEANIYEQLSIAVLGRYMSEEEFSINNSMENVKSELEKENFTENIAGYYYVSDKNIGRIVIEKSGDYYFYKIRETGTVERDYDIYQGDEIPDLYVNDNGFTEQEMDEWLSGLEYDRTLDIGGVKGGYFCKYLVNTQTDSIEGDIGYIVAVDVSRALVNDTIQETGLTGYALIAGYNGKSLESAKVIYSTNDCDTPELGQIGRGWQGVTLIEAPTDEKYHISLIYDELKPGIFAWMSWEYQK